MCSNCGIIHCKNGYYLTNEDFPSWQDYFTNLMASKDDYKICEEIDGCADLALRVKTITFVVTLDCPLRCKYCYQPHKRKVRMTKEIAKKAIDMILNKEKVNGYYDSDYSQGVIIEFIGGEPLLEIELMDYIIEYFKFKSFEMDHPWATNYRISITTNGVLFKSKSVQDFMNKNKGMVSLTITIDGNKELHDSCRVFEDGSGSYDIVEEAVKYAITNGMTQDTKITLAPSNIMHLNDAIRNVWNLGIINVASNCVFEEGWEIEHAKIFYTELKRLGDYMIDNTIYNKRHVSLFDETIGSKLLTDRNWCGGNGDMLAIGPDGRCFPCLRFMEFTLTNPNVKEQCIGDIEKGLDAKEENEWLKKLKTITMSTQSTDKCNNCEVATGCSLCVGYNYDKFGDPNIRATFICEMHQARVMANAYYWNKLYSKLGLEQKFNLNIPKDWALKIIDEDEYNMLVELSK